jgi:hypothetical protein
MNAASFLASGTARALLIAGLGLVLATATGCPSRDQCEVHEDCAEGEVCSDDGFCEAFTDLCADVTCPGAQTCDAATGDCTGNCCTSNTCVGIPGSTCDEDRCRDGADACVAPSCDPECGLNEVCNLATETCEPACIANRCDPVYYKCDEDPGSATYGDCVPGMISEGEIGWPCSENADCTDGACIQIFNSDALNFCTRACTDDAQCPVGSYCEAQVGHCFLACDDSGFQDCPPSTQCIDDIGLQHPVCLKIFEESGCDDDCLPEHSACDPDASDECEAGLSCIGYGDDAFCQRTQCHYLDGGCADGDACLNLGNNLSACFQGCDPADPTACGDFACLLENRIDGPRDTFWFANTEEECTSAGYDADAIPGGGFTCHVGCSADSDCLGGQFCNELALFDGADPISTCVNYAIVGGACSADPCPGDTTCTDLGGTGADASAVCYLACDEDADCTDDFGGTCRRFGFTGGGSMSLCVYVNQGAFCLWGCDDDADCGYCESDADCPTRTAPDGSTQQTLCDYASNTCVMPVTSVAQVSQRCREGQTRNPDGIEREDGSTTGGCATACDDDLDCAGECHDGFCRPVATTCNAVTGQCEAKCDGGDDCIHGTCAGDRCALGCDETADCAGLGVCYENEVNYCILDCSETGCAEGSTCDEEGSGLCYADPEWVTLTIDDVDVLAEGGVTYVSGSGARIVWETAGADGIRIYAADYSAEGCPDADSEDWTLSGDDDASGDIAIPAPMAGNHCIKLVAENHLVDTAVVFYMVDLPGVDITVTSVVGVLAAAATVELSIQLNRVVDLVVTAQEYDDQGVEVGDAREVENCARTYGTPSNDTVSCADTVTFLDGVDDVDNVVYTATALDPESDENEDTATASADDLEE